jgi:hypothetical protein
VCVCVCVCVWHLLTRETLASKANCDTHTHTHTRTRAHTHIIAPWTGRRRRGFRQWTDARCRRCTGGILSLSLHTSQTVHKHVCLCVCERECEHRGGFLPTWQAAQDVTKGRGLFGGYFVFWGIFCFKRDKKKGTNPWRKKTRGKK